MQIAVQLRVSAHAISPVGVDLDMFNTRNGLDREASARVFVLQSAGNLATTQEVLDRIQVDIDTPGNHESLLSVNRMFEAALYIGRLSHEVNQRHWAALNAVGADGTATFILGGQIAGLAPDILLVYPEGNYIRASDDRPFLQIGESKFGKFLLEMAVEAGAG